MNKLIFLTLLLPLHITAQTALDYPGWYNYNPANSPLPDNKISVVRASPDGTVWVGCTQTGGLVQIGSGDDWQFWNTTNSSFVSNSIHSIAIDTVNENQPVIYIGIGAGGLYKIRGNNLTRYRTTNSGISGDDVYSVATSPDGTIGVTTSQGIDLFDGDTAWFNYNASNMPSEYSELSFSYGVGLLFEEDNLWVTTSNQGTNIHKLNRTANSWMSYSNTPFEVISTSAPFKFQGGIHMGVLGDNDNVNGSYIKAMLSLEEGEWTYQDRYNSDIPGIPYGHSFDGHGNVWIVCDYGISKYDGTTFVNWHPYNSPLPIDLKTLTSIAVDKQDRVWVATAAHGLYMFDQREYESYINGLEENELGSISVFPNPSENQFTISLSKSSITDVHLSLTDLVGREIERFTIKAGSEQLTFGTNLVSGIYMLRPLAWKGVTGLRIVKN
jgi:hypothetical protein